MSAKIRRKKKDIPVGRPSVFFLVALALGVILLAWAAYQIVTRPMMPPPKRTGYLQPLSTYAMPAAVESPDAQRPAASLA